MRKNLLITLLLLLSVTMSAQLSNNKYESEWKQVAQFDEESLPQSAAKTVDAILQKAIKENNATQVIKALIHKNKYKKAIDYTDSEGLFTDLQNLIAQTNDIPEKALLHSMLAELYADYYNNNRWEINQRTALSDLVPNDMKEWTANIFADKIIENLNLSVKHVIVLKEFTTKEYDDIINIGTEGKRYYPTLYDFLMLRTIGVSQSADAIGDYRNFDVAPLGLSIDQLILPASEYIKLDINAGADNKLIVLYYYQQYLKDLLSRGQIPTIILVEIDKVEFLSAKSRSFSGEKVLNAYLKLEEVYRDNEATVEIINKIVDSFGFDNTDQKSINMFFGSSGFDDANQNNISKSKYEWLQKGLQKYPDYYAISFLKNKLINLETPTLNISGKTTGYSKDSVKLDITYQNIQALKETQKLEPYRVEDFTLYKIEKGKYIAQKDYSLNLSSNDTYSTNKQSINIGTLPVGAYCFSNLSPLALSQPIRERIQRDDANRFNFIVSNLMSFSRNSAFNEYEIFVVDRLSGKPIKDAKVKVYPNTQNDDQKSEGKVISLSTNDLGLVVYKDVSGKKNVYPLATYSVGLGADSCLEKANINSESYRWEQRNYDNQAELTTTVLLDRSIYRPGQTVYFKAIVLSGTSKPLANKTFDVDLYNANDELIAEKEIMTNEFGSISGEFILPQSGLLGSYHIEVENSSAYFNVEEYKRPTFELTFDKVEETYTFGEEVKVKGHAKNFSGISLQGADVRYTIMREKFNFWHWGSGDKTQFANDTVRTKADGSFEIVFTPQAGDGDGPSLFRPMVDKQVYTFYITATLTDVNGETQTNTFTLTVGNVSMVINIDIPEQIEKSTDYKFNIEARNLQGQNIETSGTYAIYTLNDVDSVQTKVLSGSFKSGEQAELKSKLKSLTSGKYQIQVKAKDSKGNELDEKKNFVLYSYADKKPPIKTNSWLVKKNDKFGKDGKPVEIIFGTSEKDAYVLYQVYNNKQVFERRFVKLNNANELFTLPYKADYGKEIYMSFISVKDGVLSIENVLLSKEEKKVETDLKMKLEVFRDKLVPGQEETWTLSVKDTTNNPVAAELIASMYDASLDKLNSYIEWSLNRPYTYSEYLYPINYNSPWYGNSNARWFDLNYKAKYDTISPRTIDVVNWFGYLPQYRGNNILDGRINPSDIYYKEDLQESVVASAARPSPQMSNALTGRVAGLMVYKGEGGVAEDNMNGFFIRGISTLPNSASALVLIDGYEANINSVNPNEIESFSVLKDASATAIYGSRGANGVILITTKKKIEAEVRRNFNETAFFFPQLRTNEKGETLISFKVPDSNTTWRFRALAHDKDARVGTLEQMVMTRKELMVTPNMPRFVRQGDKTSISTKISNLSDNTIAGDVHIEFFDPVTNKTIDLAIANQKQSFSIEKDASTSASWTFDIPSGIELLGCRVIAQNETFSDGEQHVLAVLSNRMLVTESMPIDVTQTGTSTFTFDKLANNSSTTTNNYKLTLEYASNPAWYAVQALPTMSNPTNENAISWFASYYVNTLGSSIVRQYPKVSAMIEAWKKQGGDKETLVSKLQKNEELKAVLLEETPWVLDAKDETEQMQRLSLLFDLNNTKQLTDAATRKLSELITADGGWGWYKGFYASRSITQYILFRYATLQQIAEVEYPQEIKEMQISALKYIDKQILEDYNSLKKYNKDWNKITSVSTAQLEYAYVRSFYRDIPINQETRTAERFYTDVASKNWTKLDLYERAILSMVLQQNGEKELANKIVKSIKEHAVKDKSMGMYWANNRSNVFLSMSAVSTHTFLMDALRQNGASQEEMDMMNRWLLKQKQTQVWESTNATINAISAMLSTSKNWFSGETSPATISVGGVKVEPTKEELGTGYFKQTWDKSEITNSMGKVEITTTGTQPAYGAMYWQYFEDLNKITAQKGELNVEKQLFKENTTAAGKGLTQITESNVLTIGDKVVVRLTIRVNRDMEFVQLKDMRAPCFEPEQTISGTKFADRLMYYQMAKDASTNFYFDHLPKGTYVLEYPVYVNRSGEYSNGITTIQCMYAPEFVSHTQGITVTVKDK